MSLSQYQCLQNRSDEDKTSENKHFEQMETIVSGKGPELIKKLEFEPGTLSIFQGTYFLLFRSIQTTEEKPYFSTNPTLKTHFLFFRSGF